MCAVDADHVPQPIRYAGHQRDPRPVDRSCYLVAQFGRVDRRSHLAVTSSGRGTDGEQYAGEESATRNGVRYG